MMINAPIGWADTTYPLLIISNPQKRIDVK